MLRLWYARSDSEPRYQRCGTSLSITCKRRIQPYVQTVAEQIVYIVADIETDGPVPGCHAMRNLSAVATDQTGTEIGAFSVNIAPPIGTSPDPDTLS